MASIEKLMTIHMIKEGRLFPLFFLLIFRMAELPSDFISFRELGMSMKLHNCFRKANSGIQ